MEPSLFEKIKHALRTGGIKKLIRHGVHWILKKLGIKHNLIQVGSKESTNHPTVQNSTISANLLDDYHTMLSRLKPLVCFQSGEKGLRLNLVTDSINSGSLFGGVATAIIFSAILANEWDCDLRIITRIESAQKTNFYKIINLHNIKFNKNIEFEFAPYSNKSHEIPIRNDDVFITTSWWTTSGVKKTFGSNKIIYLLQEDERTFYSYSDLHLQCTQILSDSGVHYVINTKLLYDHFVNQGFDNIKDNGLWFEPSFPKSLFHHKHSMKTEKKNFFFYCRPRHFRNLYHLGIEVIEKCIEEKIINTAEWNIYFVGSNIPENLPKKFKNSEVFQGLLWSDYAELLRKIDIGLSLMYSSHPSYPPLDLAASGAVVITNKYGEKQNLDMYSKNIICCDLNIDDLVNGVKHAIEINSNRNVIRKNFEENGILQDWSFSFGDVIKNTKKENYVQSK
jgi:O-antigen biosynthesis protein